MGGYLGVQQGSKFPPQFIHLTYKPANPSPDVVKVALIGKGLTFDSGGYNLKAGAGSMIELMKFDMGGCAAVLGTAKAISQLRPNVSSDQRRLTRDTVVECVIKCTLLLQRQQSAVRNSSTFNYHIM
jgi:hypothetical protein